jgi:hypothetical protein
MGGWGRWGWVMALLIERKGNNEEKNNNNQIICYYYCLLHTRKKRGKQDYRGGSTKKQTQTKTKIKATRVYNNSEKGLFNLEKNTTMKKNVMTTIVAPTSYTQKRKEGSKIIVREALGNKHKPNPRAKPQKFTTTVKRVCSI